MSPLNLLVFTSPEIAISKWFNTDVLKHTSFSSKLCMLAVDEAHLVVDWREFRPDYYDLGMIRARLPDGVPLFAASATLDQVTLSMVRDRCGFDANHRLIKITLNRPEIYIHVSPLLKPASGMLDLQWLLPRDVVAARDIPKTIVFIDSIAYITQLCSLMRKWMNQLLYPPGAARWVSPFFSDMAQVDKDRIAANFAQPSDKCLEPRIMIATDVYGLGIDNLDVERVIQWLLQATMARLYQRMGRAVRSGQSPGHFTLLYPPWCEGPKSGPLGTQRERDGGSKPGAGGSSKRKVKKPRATDADRRRDMAPGLYNFINASVDGTCVRRVGLEFFQDTAYDSEGYLKPSPCCSGCDPNAVKPIGHHASLETKPLKDSLRRPWVMNRLN